MLHLKISGQPFLIPTSWDEVTIKQFMALAKPENADVLSALSILTGLTKETIAQADVKDIENKVLPHLDFKNDLPDFEKMKQDIPETITIGTKVLPVIKSLELKTFGQKYMLEDAMRKALNTEGNLMSCIATALAIYFYPDYYNEKFDGEKVEEFITVCEQCSFTKSFAVANFFLNKSAHLILKNKSYLNQVTIQTKLQPVSGN